MAQLSDIIRYCDQRLSAGDFADYCPNGLQVAGKDEVRRLVSGVTACQALLDAAIDHQADLILVHHGYFWRGEPAPLVGIKGRRIRTLMQNDIGLLAYHLPLDAQPELGNNRQLAEKLEILDPTALPGEQGLLWHGRLAEPLTAEAFAARVARALGREPTLIQAGDQPIARLAWCTGGAQKYIDQVTELGVDAYLSGEISESTTHSAREAGLHYFAAGHHATERYGVQALGRELAEHFGLAHEFIDIANPA